MLFQIFYSILCRYLQKQKKQLIIHFKVLNYTKSLNLKNAQILIRSTLNCYYFSDSSLFSLSWR